MNMVTKLGLPKIWIWTQKMCAFVVFFIFTPWGSHAGELSLFLLAWSYFPELGWQKGRQNNSEQLQGKGRGFRKLFRMCKIEEVFRPGV